MYKVDDTIMLTRTVWHWPRGSLLKIIEIGDWGGYKVRATDDCAGDVLLAPYEFVVAEFPTEEALQELV